jgi:hypothetical protein
MIPTFLLAKLYVKGSLKNNETGFEFNLKNIVDATTLIGIGPIEAGGKSYETGSITMMVAGTTFRGEELSREHGVPVRMGVPITVKVDGKQLAAGEQKIALAATTSDIGKIKFEIKDTISGA